MWSILSLWRSAKRGKLPLLSKRQPARIEGNILEEIDLVTWLDVLSPLLLLCYWVLAFQVAQTFQLECYQLSGA